MCIYVTMVTYISSQLLHAIKNSTGLKIATDTVTFAT